MPEYLAPGVYIEEIEIGSKPIEGVSTSTAGFLGPTERGPLKPKLITSFEEYKRIYGGYLETSYLAYGVEGFFRNGGSRCYLARIVGSGSVKASLELGWGAKASLVLKAGAVDVMKVEALAYGTEGDSIQVEVADGGTSGFKLTITNGTTNEEYDNLSTDKTSDSFYEKKVNGISALVSLKWLADGEPDNTTSQNLAGGVVSGKAIKVEAQGPGTWGKEVKVTIGDSGLGKAELFKLTLVYNGIAEVYDNLSTVVSSSDYYVKRVNGISALVTLESLAAIRPNNIADEPLDGGTEGSDIAASDFQGSRADPENPTGLAAFEEVDDIAILCVPDENDYAGVTALMVDHCENMKDRFAILQAPQSGWDISSLEPPLDSKYAAFYFPWIRILDPASNLYKLVPPGGYVAGVFSRTDQERGVHKAPANEVVRGVASLQINVTKKDQDVLNPKGVNCIRAFPGRGIRIWGARTTSSDPSWKYVNVRRLFLFIEESIDEGTQWVVFEPNDEKLWAKVRQTVEEFLTRVWRDGALMGTVRDDAFFVRCDRTTMTQDDINNGRLIVLVGVAPVKPAEFVIFRIAQVAKGSDIAEA
ncbi:MAG: phage tail sheath subtilisin-like domain-containing protein [Methanotrichaceae archaeon]|nr:phage tail sheath subtilisin-like domain-containing protein [Methanotrichaceae archaeon]